jgi:hypothetical protein
MNNVDHKIGQLEGRLDGLERRVDGIEQRIDAKLQKIDQDQDKISNEIHQITIIVGSLKAGWKVLTISGVVIASILSGAAWLISTFHPFGIGL